MLYSTVRKPSASVFSYVLMYLAMLEYYGYFLLLCYYEHNFLERQAYWATYNSSACVFQGRLLPLLFRRIHKWLILMKQLVHRYQEHRGRDTTWFARMCHWPMFSKAPSLDNKIQKILVNLGPTSSVPLWIVQVCIL